MIPVYDSDNRFLGYFEDDRVAPYRDRSVFKLQAQQRMLSVLDGPEVCVPETITIEECTFRWDIVTAHHRRAIYRCDVLVTMSPYYCIGDIRGFKWLAEVHGKPVPAVDAKIA